MNGYRCAALFVAGVLFAAPYGTNPWLIAADLAAFIGFVWLASPLWRKPRPTSPAATVTINIHGASRTYELAREVEARMRKDGLL